MRGLCSFFFFSSSFFFSLYGSSVRFRAETSPLPAFRDSWFFYEVKISVQRHTCTLESQVTLFLCGMSFRTCPTWLAPQEARLSPVGLFCLLELQWLCWLSTSTDLMFRDTPGDDPAMWYVTRFATVFKKRKWAHDLAHMGLHTWLVSKCNSFSPWRGLQSLLLPPTGLFLVLTEHKL